MSAIFILALQKMYMKPAKELNESENIFSMKY